MEFRKRPDFAVEVRFGVHPLYRRGGLFPKHAFGAKVETESGVPRQSADVYEDTISYPFVKLQVRVT